MCTCISPYLTQKERFQKKFLRDELKARGSAGEKNIYIRWGKIVNRDFDAGTSASPPHWQFHAPTTVSSPIKKHLSLKNSVVKNLHALYTNCDQLLNKFD